MIRRPPRSTLSSSSAASDVYKRQGETCQWALSDCEFDPKQPVWFEVSLQVTLSNRQLALKAPDTFQALCDGEAVVTRNKKTGGNTLAPNEDLGLPPSDLPAGLPKHKFRQRVSSTDPDYWTKKGMIFPKSDERWGGEWTDDMRRRIEDVQTQRKFVLGWYAHNERMLDEGKLPAKWLEYREHMRLSIEMGDDAPMRFLVNKALPAVRSADVLKVARAAAAGDAEELQVLLDALPHMSNGTPDEFGLSPLHKAAMGGHVKTVMVLLAHGADVNLQSKFLFTALHCAAVAGHKAITWLLLHAGADLTVLDEDDKTALMLAQAYDRIEIVAMLTHPEAWVRELEDLLGSGAGGSSGAPGDGLQSATSFFETFDQESHASDVSGAELVGYTVEDAGSDEDEIDADEERIEAALQGSGGECDETGPEWSGVD
eukprot:TRINITY_DN19683_c0_g1_i3.p1 TRINITY_DN19683_c0_g1~~TRINITY_DN19683_c0_g1_i3.p1  ORF type:complete len:428 (+),score=119.59 TRINITY_DN19683_c0_g1_i3:108-1391(+)